MSNGYSPVFPLQFSAYGGYALNQDIKSVIKQNLKMLFLTSPGERIMYPNLGVGLKRFLFEQSTEETYDAIKDRIYSQVEEYMPFIDINELIIEQDQEEMNLINIKMYYYIPSLSAQDVLSLNVSN